MTPTRADLASPTAARTGTYVVCLDCGKEFPYNWRELRIERPDPAPRPPKPAKAKRTANWLLQPLLRFLS